jgi:hypothetical protein
VSIKCTVTNQYTPTSAHQYTSCLAVHSTRNILQRSHVNITDYSIVVTRVQEDMIHRTYLTVNLKF